MKNTNRLKKIISNFSRSKKRLAILDRIEYIYNKIDFIYHYQGKNNIEKKVTNNLITNSFEYYYSYEIKENGSTRTFVIPETKDEIYYHAKSLKSENNHYCDLDDLTEFFWALKIDANTNKVTIKPCPLSVVNAPMIDYMIRELERDVEIKYTELLKMLKTHKKEEAYFEEDFCERKY